MSSDLLIPFLPLAAFLIIGIGSLAGRWMDQNAHWIAVPAVAGSFAASAAAFFSVLQNGPRDLTLYTWGISGGFQATLDIRLDGLTVAMLLLVTVVSSAVHLYTIGYMNGDRGYARFFAYLGLFTFSMIMLVVARNLLQLYVFWEAVGLCSYLLIAHYYEKPASGHAAIKAFVVNRVGDFGCALGIFLIFDLVGSIDYDTIFERLPAHSGEVISVLGVPFNAITLIALLLFVGAVGKSA
ncbi:MAG TPA: proton-conducting transporter membrane subunit, partial [Nitrospiria bacterium]|nr:proton-conducting transporter membrane subunit [Nitrospiria bacterium]